jgi:hypothetical protein
MNNAPTWVKKITFELRHPAYKDNKLVRTLVVSDTVHVPEGMLTPSMDSLGLVDFDYRDPGDYDKIRELIIKEVIRSKIDGLPPHAVSDVIRVTKESTFQIITTATDRIAGRPTRRFGIKLTLEGRENESLWYGGSDMPVYHFVGGEWSGVGDPMFDAHCCWVGKLVATQKAEEILRDWQRMGFNQPPIKTDVQELCYAKQTIQLVSEVQRDALAGGVTAFGSRALAELDLH